ncbi:gas vesicle protein [Sinomonas albida]|uniref:gas vesicle protein n=1 Tax=Sinomonas albida TaxID=369942 RepID=UPI0010A7A8E3|nr:gas vesicle protein [Sinomonas albida]
MEPVRESESAVSALVDTLLTKGVYLDVDAIITVAEIPLIGVSLRAAIAGMETLLEYGMMREWDERARAGSLQPASADDGGLPRLSGARPGLQRPSLQHPSLQHPSPQRSGSQQSDAPAAAPEGGASDGEALEGEALYLETRSQGEVWRRGTARWDASTGFAWRGEGDRRPAVQIAPAELEGVRAIAGEDWPEAAPELSGRRVLALATAGWEAVVAVDRSGRWEAALRREEVPNEHAAD